ncbi:MAG: sugar-binding protein [Chthoniobacteraceae bacterium]
MKTLLPCCMLLSSLLLNARADEPVFDVPYIKGVTIDGKGTHWGDKGFRVETLAGSGGEVREPQDFDAKFRLAWDEQGLLVLVTVHDDQIAEAEKPADLFLKDSVEMFLGVKRGEPQYFQVLAGTGADPKFPVLRTFIHDLRKPPAAEKPEAEVASGPVVDGYMLEARLPWKDLGIVAKEGEEVAFQLVVNDVDGDGPRLSVSWHPSIKTTSDPKAMMRVRLSAKASPAVQIAARVSLDHGNPRVDVIAPADVAGKSAAVRIGGKNFAASTFEMDAGRARASFLVPNANAEIICPGIGNAFVDGSDLETQITDAISSAQVIFRPCVFSGEKFPDCDFSRRENVEEKLGKCELTPTFYDADYHEVKSATKPGRYGTIVVVKTGTGQTFKRFVTLYRMEKDFNWRLAKFKLQPESFPPEAGIDPAVLQEQGKDIGELFSDLFRWNLGLSTSPAILLAGLHEMKPGAGPTVDRTSSNALDQKWWYGLKKATGNLRMDYYVHLPAGYDADPQKKWPLILSLHGSGERGYDINAVKANGLPKNMDAQPDFPFIVIAPQCSPTEWWSPPELNALLDRMEEKYRVDIDRVYLTGLSMGGYGSWALATESPERFAAVVPICGGGDPDDAARIKDVPIWVFHGGKDPTVPLEQSQRMVDALKKLGSNVKFTIFPEAKHDSWTQAYAMPELYEWLLQQKRGVAQKTQ